MSGLGRKRVSKWDSNEDTDDHHYRSSVNTKSSSHYRDKEVEVETSNGSRRKEQYTNDSRNRSNNDNHNSYYSEQDETRQQFFQRSGSRSRSRSRSRSPVYRGRQEAGGSYERHNTRTQVSPPRSKEFNRRSGVESSDYGREGKMRTEYQSDDFREQAMMKGARPSDDNSRREQLHDGVSDPRLKRQRSELPVEKETQRRDGDFEGEFHRSSNISCKFFVSGFCRNGNYCRFSHHVDGADSKQPQANNDHNGRKWDDVERDGMEVSRTRKGNSDSRGNDSSWIDNMEMSPDWNYGVRSLKNPVKKDDPGQSTQSRVLKDDAVTNYGQTSNAEKPTIVASVTNYDQTSNGMLSYGEKPIIAASYQNHNNSVNTAQTQVFNHSHSVLPYIAAGGSQQVLAATAANVPAEKAVPAQSTVTREQIDEIANISASLDQFLANEQPIQQPKKSLHTESSMSVQPNQAIGSSNPDRPWGIGMSTSNERVPAVTNEIQELPEEKKTEEDGKKTEENVKDEDGSDDEDGSEEENKKGKDTKGVKAFKFALVEIVKELLKPTWKEGKMNKDSYKNIVKKVVEKVTSTIQTGNVPQTQDKIDHYLSASKPKITKLVQAYISKVKKN